MTVFSSCFLFLRNPRGGVEDLAAMEAAGYAGVALNVGDHEPSEWEAIVRPRALAAGMWCAPWARTQGADGSFDHSRAIRLLDVAERWGSPVVVNSENELKGTGDEITEWLAEELYGFDAALSMEYWPFADVAWYPLASVPVLPQLFPESGQTDVASCLAAWWSYGIRCVYPTFASYGGRQPSDYALQAPYSLYTADDCAGDYRRWGPTSTGFSGCSDASEGGSMGLIGTQDGINAAVDRLIALDPGGSRPNRNPADLSTWGAYDKLRRTLTMLREDHDRQAAATDAGTVPNE